MAEKFGGQGFRVAIAARTASRLDEAVKTLKAKGVDAVAVKGDLGDPESARKVVRDARAALGSIGVVHWNAYAGDAGDLLTADAAAIHKVLDVAVTNLVAVVQEALPDLEREKGALLVTNGGFGFADPQVDAIGVHFSAMGLSVANAAKHKLVGLLSKKLEPKGIYVGEVMVTGMVKGTAFDSGSATIEAATVAGKFWDLYSARNEVRDRA
jgi:NAD(P)-dependent dehydrogenase (short-subunit alcohol dehydrogenase family)